MKPNIEVLKLCNMTGIEAFLITAQLRWTGKVIRMDDDRLMKTIFYSELEDGTRSRGGQRKRYKDLLKTNKKCCDLPPNDLAVMAVNRSEWRSCSKNAVQTFEAERGVQTLEAKRSQWKTRHKQTTANHRCNSCG